jgi:dipeptidase E
MTRSVLLLSSSYVHGHGFLEYQKEVVTDFLTGVTSLLFVPYAAAQTEWNNYTKKARSFFTQLGIEVTGIHKVSAESIGNYKAIFIGGGNTFRLLHKLQSDGLLPVIRSAVMSGHMLYMGSSAGTNVACRTIRTTNDMPIVHPAQGFDALDLFPYQINPHYIDPDTNSKHMGETRDQRIAEFHQENDAPVIGLREGAYISFATDVMETKQLFLGGAAGAKIFLKGKEPIEVHYGQLLTLEQDHLHI